MKLKACPKCGCKNLGDRWTNGRKLEQYCLADGEEEYCTWVGQPRTPERKRITNTKDLRVDEFYGWDYIVYDKFGHASTYSQTFGTEREAMTDLADELKQGVKDKDGGPYTAVLFKTPSKVVLKGKMFKFKSGIVTKIK